MAVAAFFELVPPAKKPQGTLSGREFRELPFPCDTFSPLELFSFCRSLGAFFYFFYACDRCASKPPGPPIFPSFPFHYEFFLPKGSLITELVVFFRD